MSIISFLYLLGIINTFYSFVWKWIVAVPIAFLFTIFKFDRGILIVRIFGAYLLVSVVALATLLAIEDESGWKIVGFPIIGAFVLFMGFASNVYQQRKEAMMNQDYNLISQLKRDSWFTPLLMFGSPIFFLVTLFVPSIISNSLNTWIFDLFIRIYGLPIIGWLIGIGGIFFMLGYVWYGFLMISSLIGLIYSKIKRESA